MSQCKDKCSRLLLLSAVYLMFQTQDQQECTVPINHWVLVMWCLLCTKYLTMGDRPPEFDLKTLVLGSNFSNPIIFFWLVVGIRYVSKAKGNSCYTRTSLSVVVFQIIVGASTILLFIMALILLALFLINKLLYLVLRLFWPRERVERVLIFRGLLQLPRRLNGMQQPENLSMDQMEELKRKTERILSVEQEHLPRFAENPCSICLDHLTEGNRFISLKCSHFFHTNCLGVWLAQKSSCPLCKEEVKVEDYPNSFLDTGSSDSAEIISEGLTDAGGGEVQTRTALENL
jgi:uncharacterized membrane protein YqjE